MKIDSKPADPNTEFLIKDLIQGDDSVADRELFERLDEDDIVSGLKLIRNNPYLSEATKAEVLANIWRINYKQRPPTIEEFLTEDWVGPMSESLYPHARNILTDFWKSDSPYRHLIMAMAIGTGKSTIIGNS